MSAFEIDRKAVDRIMRRRRDAEARQVAGYRDHTVARSTGTTVLLVDGYAQGLESPGGDGERWFLICDEHGGCCGFSRQADASAHLAHPEAWCPTCQGYPEP